MRHRTRGQQIQEGGTQPLVVDLWRYVWRNMLDIFDILDISEILQHGGITGHFGNRLLYTMKSSR